VAEDRPSDGEEPIVKVAVLGSGVVGQTLAAKLAALGHDTMLGTRDVAALLARTEPGPMQQEPFAAWHERHPEVALGSFAEAAGHGELVVNATAGGGSLDALRQAGAANLDGKVLVDVANPLDFSSGMPPTLSVANTDSLSEQIQRAFPEAKVVKTLNTMTAALMVDPGQLAGGDHHVFVSGDDPEAKAQVAALLTDGFGWRQVIDLGDITTARGVEMYLPLWLRLFGAVGTPLLNLKVVT
jgi:predicted dinucleotide-binding enzyme